MEVVYGLWWNQYLLKAWVTVWEEVLRKFVKKAENS